MKILIVKLGATGDVVRTTALLHVLAGDIHWLSYDHNLVLLDSIPEIARGIPWTKKHTLTNEIYDLVINLEDEMETAQFLQEIKYKELYGAYLNNSHKITYTDSSKEWFDLSIISRYGKKKADILKSRNRRTYQELVFEGLGYSFSGQKYFLPRSIQTDLMGDIAIASESGPVWPMKKWAYYNELKDELERAGYAVNFLPQRKTLLEHIGDIQNHRYLISGDSLPMHIALGSDIRCLTIFICTSPWEIYDYNLQRKMISPCLERYFYKRTYDPRATISISLNEVYQQALQHLSLQAGHHPYPLREKSLQEAE